MPLSPKQQRFVEEYLVDLNATQAAIRAGYSERTAKQQGERLLTKVDVQLAISVGRNAQRERTNIDADRVLLEYVRLGFSDIGNVIDFSGPAPRLRPTSQITESARRSLSSVKVKRYTEGRGDDAEEVEIIEFKLWDKVVALAKLAAHVGVGIERPPLELILAALPSGFADAVRAALASDVFAQENSVGGTPATIANTINQAFPAPQPDPMGGNPPSASPDNV